MAQENLKLKKYQSVVLVIIALFMLFSVIFSYLRTEILTNSNQTEFNIKELCPENENLKYYKITDLQKIKGSARIYCIYNNPSQNIALQLNKNNQNQDWKILYQEKLNQPNNLYFPIYL